MKNMTAHTNGSDITSLCFSYDNLTLASRGGIWLSCTIINQSFSHLFVSDQWSISKMKKEIDNKRRNKTNKSSTQCSLENSIAKTQKRHANIYI